MNFSRGFFKGQRLRWREREYVVEGRLGNRRIELKAVLSGVSVVEKDEVLAEYFFTGELICLDRTDGKAACEKRDTRILVANFNELADDARLKAIWRFAYVKAYLSANLDKMIPEEVLPIIAKTAIAINDPEPPSFSTLRRWVKKYLDSGGNVRSLADNTLGMGNCVSRLQPEVVKILTESTNELYLTQQLNNGAVVYTRIEMRVTQENRNRKHFNSSAPADKQLEMLRLPSRPTFYHHLRKLDPYKRDCARLGERLANLKYFASNKGARPIRALQRMELDHTYIPAIIVDEKQLLPIGRPVLTLGYDKFTDYPLGFYCGFESPSYTSIAKCIGNAIRPKNYVRERYPSVQNDWNAFGVAETAFCDDGPDFWSTDLEEACLQIGTLLEYAPSRHPWWKGSIERHFLTLKTGLVHRLPGAELTKLLDRAEYDPRKDAILSMSQFLEIFHIWLIDIYMQTPRRGRSSTPAIAWERAIEKYPPTLPPNPRDFDIFLFKHDTRYLHGRGIEYEGLWFNAPELMGLRRKLQQLPHRPKVKIKIDPDDISCIYVQNSDTKNYIVAPAVCQNYAKGLTLWHHTTIKENAKLDREGAVNIEALCEARERIHAIVQQEWSAGKAKQSRKLSHRWLSGVPLALQVKSTQTHPQAVETDGCVPNEDPTTWAGFSKFASELPQSNEQQSHEPLSERRNEPEVEHANVVEKSNEITGGKKPDSGDRRKNTKDELDCSGWSASKRT